MKCILLKLEAVENNVPPFTKWEFTQAIVSAPYETVGDISFKLKSTLAVYKTN